jgi:ribosomal protein L12E/L44/L45/RPP1/RPP2
MCVALQIALPTMTVTQSAPSLPLATNCVHPQSSLQEKEKEKEEEEEEKEKEKEKEDLFMTYCGGVDQ